MQSSASVEGWTLRVRKEACEDSRAGERHSTPVATHRHWLDTVGSVLISWCCLLAVSIPQDMVTCHNIRRHKYA